MGYRIRVAGGLAGFVVALGPGLAVAQTAPGVTPPGMVRLGTDATVTLSGYLETFYQWNFNEPSNGVTNYRGFDDRHNTFALENVVLDTSASLGPVQARIALQWGLTGETYYASEPALAGTSGAGGSSAAVWKFVQQANAGFRVPMGRGVLVEAGLFVSPIGPEGFAVKDQWNWSRSNLFFGLPFYHTGVRVSYPFTERVSATVAVYNGWNSVVDNNLEKSLEAHVSATLSDRVSLQVLYFGGVERNRGAPEGRAFRHLFDAYVLVQPASWVWLSAHGDAGFEPNNFGVSWWAAGALSARAQPTSFLYVAVRGDYFYESVAQNALGRAAAIFWPAQWVASGTATVDVRPHSNASVRLEYRHDEAAGAVYFRGAVAVDAMGAAVTNARTQDTITLGMTAWF